MENIFKFAKIIAEKASNHILKNHKNIKKITFKKGHFNLVTNVDKETEDIIVRAIKSKFPSHSIIAEESGLHNQDPAYQWFIDPIDGTTNFAHSYPFFCTSIGFAKNGVIQFGIVKDPISGDTYTAIKGKGAKLNGKKISVSSAKNLKESLLATGFPHDKKKSKYSNFYYFRTLTLESQGVRRDGAAALDLCYVASGKLDGFWEQKLNPWDVAAGMLILTEAGGKVTDFQGKQYSVYGKEILATNGKIHKEMIGYLKN